MFGAIPTTCFLNSPCSQPKNGTHTMALIHQMEDILYVIQVATIMIYKLNSSFHHMREWPIQSIPEKRVPPYPCHETYRYRTHVPTSTGCNDEPLHTMIHHLRVRHNDSCIQRRAKGTIHQNLSLKTRAFSSYRNDTIRDVKAELAWY